MCYNEEAGGPRMVSLPAPSMAVSRRFQLHWGLLAQPEAQASSSHELLMGDSGFSFYIKGGLLVSLEKGSFKKKY